MYEMEMEGIESFFHEERFDDNLDLLSDIKLSKDVDSITTDWTFLEDIEITHDKYISSPLCGDLLSEPSVGGQSLCSSNDVDSRNEKGANNTSCKCDASDTDSQYDSGIGDSLSGEDPESSGSSERCKDFEETATTAVHKPTELLKTDVKYNLRTTSLINRVEVEQKKRTPKQPKPKNKPAPLSKYRRKTANARERSRMTEINEAFEDLQKVIPQLPKGKLTKITTLHLAMNYITALRELLASGETGDSLPQEEMDISKEPSLNP